MIKKTLYNIRYAILHPITFIRYVYPKKGSISWLLKQIDVIRKYCPNDYIKIDPETKECSIAFKPWVDTENIQTQTVAGLSGTPNKKPL